ncbi:MAG: hypothetical protein OHK0029_02000 [Armatimonadaceae bacterium]
MEEKNRADSAASSADPAVTEVRRIRRLLRELNKLADNASLTGSLKNGASEAVEMYNMALNRLRELGIDATTLFRELPTDAGFDKVGVASRLLYSYLGDEDSEAAKRPGAPNIVIGNLSGLGELDKLRDLGQTIRENLRDFLREKLDDVEGEAPVKRAAPVPPTPPTPPTPPAPPIALPPPTDAEPETIPMNSGAEPESRDAVPMPELPRR